MDLRQQRQLQLCVITLVVLALCLLAIVMGIAIYAYQKQQETPVITSEASYMGLPPAPDCSHLYNVGKSNEWRKCMGVGLRSWEKGDVR